MDIRDVSAGSLSAKSLRTATSSAVRSEAGASKPQASTKEDFFVNSGRLGEVRALIDKLVQAPDVDQERIARAKSLLQSGALDTREAATRAAGGLLEDQAAQA